MSYFRELFLGFPSIGYEPDEETIVDLINIEADMSSRIIIHHLYSSYPYSDPSYYPRPRPTPHVLLQMCGCGISARSAAGMLDLASQILTHFPSGLEVRSKKWRAFS